MYGVIPGNHLLPVFLGSLKSSGEGQLPPCRMNGLKIGGHCWCDPMELINTAGAGCSEKHNHSWQAILDLRDSDHGLCPHPLFVILYSSSANCYCHRPMEERKNIECWFNVTSPGLLRGLCFEWNHSVSWGINDHHAPLVRLIQSPCCFCCSGFHWSSWNW